LGLDAILVTAIGEAKLPVWIGLGLDRGDHGSQMIGLGIEQGHYDREKQWRSRLVHLPCRGLPCRVLQAGGKYAAEVHALPAVDQFDRQDARPLADQDGCNSAQG